MYSSIWRLLLHRLLFFFRETLACCDLCRSEATIRVVKRMWIPRAAAARSPKSTCRMRAIFMVPWISIRYDAMRRDVVFEQQQQVALAIVVFEPFLLVRTELNDWINKPSGIPKSPSPVLDPSNAVKTVSAVHFAGMELNKFKALSTPADIGARREIAANDQFACVL